METKFQTSFIPKKPFNTKEVVHTHTTSSIFMIIATLLFIASIAGAGFTFVAKGVLIKAQEEEKKNLADNQRKFNAPLIEELKKANLKIDLATQLLKHHVAVSEAFKMLAALTIEGVGFTSFEFTAPDAVAATNQPVAPAGKVQNGNNYKIKLKGLANNYNSVAFQSDVFGSSGKFGTNKVLKNPVLSDLALDEKGNVTFAFTADLTGTDISYERVLTSDLQTEGAIPEASVAPTH